jgi:hypothetical protein
MSNPNDTHHLILQNLFEPHKQDMVSFDDTWIEDIPQVFELENESLIENFIEKDVKEAIFQIEHDKAPGPNIFQLNFKKIYGK